MPNFSTSHIGCWDSFQILISGLCGECRFHRCLPKCLGGVVEFDMGQKSTVVTE